MKNEFRQACFAMVLGISIGMLVSVVAQKAINDHYVRTCHDQPGKNLIRTKSLIGDVYYCIKVDYVK